MFLPPFLVFYGNDYAKSPQNPSEEVCNLLMEEGNYYPKGVPRPSYHAVTETDPQNRIDSEHTGPKVVELDLGQREFIYVEMFF